MNNMENTYELLKDISTFDLTAKAGDIGKLKAGNKVWFNDCSFFYNIETIERYLGVWFKEVNPVPAEYEILSRFDYYERPADGELGAIKSIKRLSDNTNWTVGEKVNVNDILFDTIKGFEILNNGMNVKVGGSFIVAIIPLKDVSKYRIHLFKTEDGKDVFQGDRVWVVTNDSIIDYWLIHTKLVETIKSFSTEEKAKEYVLLHKKSFSVNDLITKFPIAGTLKDSLIKFAKEVNP